MGVAREFGPWALNAREFRRAGLNPRVWLARRVNQSATDAVGGAVIFSVNVADPSPLDAAALSLGSADPLSSSDPSLRRRGPFPTIPPSVGADPSPPFRRPSARTPSLLWTLPTIPPSVGADPRPSMDSPHHSAVRRRERPLFHGPPPFFTAADPSLPFRRPSTRTPSLHRRGPHLFHGPLPTIQSSVATDPPLSTAAREFCCASLGGARGGGASGKLRSKWC
ncbi:hypothetical protein niasHT_006419 [Heterodera trifolii]|uniref:Uncharacterized protein n=1 Tax=Heterodera trifolii TaxID=157864 RepID=A0ABD2HWI4_9BILA